jgi:pyruvate formate-lyase 1-activating enzyme
MNATTLPAHLHGLAPRDAASPMGRVHSIETAGSVDGPGLRFVLFVSGCPLRCQYCHNPDTWDAKAGWPLPAETIVAEIAKYAHFLHLAHGGVTISGGEPLSQPDFVTAVLEGAKTLGLHTALDTSGFLGDHADDRLLAATDLVLLDIKAFDEDTYHRLTHKALAPTLRFAERLAGMGKPVWLRYVLVPGLNDDPAAITALARYAAKLGNVRRVEVLPFHKMGESKWEIMGMHSPLADTPEPTPEATEKARALFRAAGFDCT